MVLRATHHNIIDVILLLYASNFIKEMIFYSLDLLIASVNFFHAIIYILLSLFVQISTKYSISKSSQHNHIPTRASASPLNQTHPHPPYHHPAPARKPIPPREETNPLTRANEHPSSPPLSKNGSGPGSPGTHQCTPSPTCPSHPPPCPNPPPS